MRELNQSHMINIWNVFTIWMKSGQNECSSPKFNRISYISSMDHVFVHTNEIWGIQIGYFDGNQYQTIERIYIGQIKYKNLVRITWMQQKPVQ